MSLEVAHVGISAPVADPVALQGVSPQGGMWMLPQHCKGSELNL